ncbi:periaxin [Pelodiscus sinensis]|uniref:periaxin n=1 Tax=Pelodiscus sinensis TaxID=13735 RepID=UPI003F6D519E
MCDCFTTALSAAWARAAPRGAERGGESHAVSPEGQSAAAEEKEKRPAQPQPVPGPRPLLTPEEASDAERAAQKEKLHAELKRVLQRKGESQPSAAAPERPPTPAMEPRARVMEEAKASELVEIILETEAKAGLSGLSVAGGGREGLFVSDVLGESPAAKALSLKEGDQLLSARVSFENVRYEDAVRILQCAEPYKVSFCLKRTVPRSDVPGGPAVGGLDVKGPQAKMARLSMRSLVPLRKAGKGPGLEAALAGSAEPAAAPVDVEFSWPKFARLRKAKSAGEARAALPGLAAPLPASQAKRRRLRFPRLRVKEAAGQGTLEGGEAGPKAKAPPFAASFFKAQRPTEGPAELELKFKAPQVELDLPKAAAGLAAPEPPGKGEGVRLQLPVLGGAARQGLEGKLAVPRVGLALPTAERDAARPQEEPPAGLHLPSVEIAAPKVELDLSLPKGEAEGPEGRPRAGVKLPSLDIGVRPVEVELPLPGGKAGAEGGAEPAAAARQLPDVTVKLPRFGLAPQGGAAEREPQADGKVGKAERGSPELKARGPKIKLPSFGLSLREHKPEAAAKAKEPAADAQGRFPGLKVPSVDLSVPKAKMELAGLAGEGKAKAPAGEAPEGPEFKFQVPQVSLPKLDLSGAAGRAESKAQAPSPTAPEAGGLELPAGRLSLPRLDISVPGITPLSRELPEAEPGTEKPKLQARLLPGKAEAKRLEAEGPAAPTRLSFPSVKLPSLDIDMPKVGVDLDLPAATPGREGELGAGLKEREQTPQEPLLKLGAICKDLQVEIDMPGPPGRALPAPPAERPDLSGAVARHPKVDISFGGLELEGAGPEGKGKAERKFPKVGLELPSPEVGTLEAKVKLPSVEISAPTLPEVTIEAGLPAELPAASGKAPEPDAKLKSPKFSFPKFSISGPKGRRGGPEAAAELEAETAEASGKGVKLKMPKFGLSFSRAKAGADAGGARLLAEGEGKSPKGKAEIPGPPIETGASDGHAKLPSVKVPAVDISAPNVGVDIGLPKGKGDAWGDGVPPPDISIEGPDVTLKMPKFSLPKFGGKSKEEALEPEPEPRKGEAKGRAEAEPDGKAKGKEAKMKMPKFKMPSVGIAKREGEVPGPSVAALALAEKAAGSPEKAKGPFVKMPTLQISSPKVGLDTEAHERGAHSPALEMKVPQVELPVFGAKAEKAGVAAAERPDSPGARLRAGLVRMPALEISVPQQAPSLQISVPSERAEGEPGTGVSEGREGHVKIPKAPSLGISAPALDLDLRLPKASVPEPGQLPEGGAALEKAESKMKLPQVELPRCRAEALLGAGVDRERGGTEAEMHLLQGEKPKGPSRQEQKIALELEGDKSAPDAAEGSLQGSKFRVPRVDISLSRARLSDAEGPLAAGESALQGLEEAEGKFKLPAVGLPTFSTPKAKAAEVGIGVGFGRGRDAALDTSGLQGKMPKVEVSGPKVKLPKFGGSGAEDQGEAERDAAKAPQVELKPPRLWGSPESPGGEGRGKDAQLQMPSVPIGFTVGKAEGAARTEDLEGRFKVKMPSFGIPRAGAEAKRGESGTDTQPLCPMAETVDFSFQVPQLAIPDVGFSVGPGDAGAGREARVRGKEPAGAAEEGDVGGFAARLKRLPFGLSGPEGDEGAGGEKSLFQVPDLELSAPSAKAEGEGERGRSSGARVGQGEAPDAEGRKKHRMKLPKFGLALPKAGGEAEAREADGRVRVPKAKKGFALGRAKGAGAEASSGLLEADGEAAAGSLEEEGGRKAKSPTIKLRPGFGLSLSKPKAVNGELESPGAGEEEPESGSTLKLPKLGFSKPEGPALHGRGSASPVDGPGAEPSLPNGSQGGAAKPGKVRLPQLELSSPYKAPEADPELSLRLVSTEEAPASTFAALKAAKFKPPKITFSGFRKKDAEPAGGVVASAARTELALLEGDPGPKLETPKISLGFTSKSKGEYDVQRGQEAGPRGELDGSEKSPKFKFPKLALSPKSRGGLEAACEPQERGGMTQEGVGALEGFKIRAPKLGFSPQPEEQGGHVKVVGKSSAI